MEVGEEAVGPFAGGGNSGGVQFGNGGSFATRLRRWNEQWTSKTEINVSQGLHLHLFCCVLALTNPIDSFTLPFFPHQSVYDYVPWISFRNFV